MITALITALGIPGVLVWFLYHTTTSTIPGLTKLYTESTERTSVKFAETQKAISDNFAATLKEERLYRREEITALQNWIKSEAACKYNTDHK